MPKPGAFNYLLDFEVLLVLFVLFVFAVLRDLYDFAPKSSDNSEPDSPSYSSDPDSLSYSLSESSISSELFLYSSLNLAYSANLSASLFLLSNGYEKLY